MSMIENALEKLRREQAAKGPQTSRTQRPAVASRTLLPDPVAHAYGGKPVQLDVALLRAQGLLGPESEQARVAEEYRAVKRPLLTNASWIRETALPRGNLIMITSAIAGEGKSFTSLNLCLSIARERDWTVVLVDADSSKPHLTRVFQAEDEPGLLDLLRASGRDFDSVVMPTSVPSLSILPLGARDEHATELLASSRMHSLCEDLATADPRRIVLFDSSPLLLTEDSRVLASEVGQVVLVVRANRTSQQAVLSACDKLDPSRANNLLLNQSDDAAPNAMYGSYGSPYGYGPTDDGSTGE